MKRIIFVTICFLALLGCSSDDNSEPPIVETKFLMGLIGEKFRIYYDDPNGYKVRNENSEVISASFGGDHWLNIILKKEGNTNITVKDVDNNEITKIVVYSSYFGAERLEELYVNPYLYPDIVVETPNLEVIKQIKSEIMTDIEERQWSVFSFNKEKKEFMMDIVQLGIRHQGTYEWDINSLTIEYDGIKEVFGFSIDGARADYILLVNRTEEYQLKFPDAGITKVTYNRVLHNLYAEPR